MTSFRKNKALLRMACFFVLMSFLSNAVLPGYARAEITLPAPNQFVALSNTYSFPVLKGLKFDPQDPFKIKFIIDSADQKVVSQEEASGLIRYFLAALTIPQDELWVNMSPYEKEKMITPALSGTDLGKDLLSQDYILKQLSSSLTYPESPTGKDFWSKTYQEVLKVAHTTKLPVNTFNKIWIVPDKAEVYENRNSVLITEASLKTMLEQDYLALKNNLSGIQQQTKNINEGVVQKISQASSKVMKENILPKINRDVNSGKNFATLRQIYHSLILAVWFKEKFKDSVYKYYIDKGKLKGIDLNDKSAKDKIYSLYVEAFKKGLYNYTKSELDLASGRQLKRQYFSGGAAFTSGQLKLNHVEFLRQNPIAGSALEVDINVMQEGVTKEASAGSSLGLSFEEKMRNLLYGFVISRVDRALSLDSGKRMGIYSSTAEGQKPTYRLDLAREIITEYILDYIFKGDMYKDMLSGKASLWESVKNKVLSRERSLNEKLPFDPRGEGFRQYIGFLTSEIWPVISGNFSLIEDLKREWQSLGKIAGSAIEIIEEDGYVSIGGSEAKLQISPKSRFADKYHKKHDALQRAYLDLKISDKKRYLKGFDYIEFLLEHGWIKVAKDEIKNLDNAFDFERFRLEVTAKNFAIEFYQKLDALTKKAEMLQHLADLYISLQKFNVLSAADFMSTGEANLKLGHIYASANENYLDARLSYLYAVNNYRMAALEETDPRKQAIATERAEITKAFYTSRWLNDKEIHDYNYKVDEMRRGKSKLLWEDDSAIATFNTDVFLNALPNLLTESVINNDILKGGFDKAKFRDALFREKKRFEDDRELSLPPGGGNSMFSVFDLDNEIFGLLNSANIEIGSGDIWIKIPFEVPGVSGKALLRLRIASNNAPESLNRLTSANLWKNYYAEVFFGSENTENAKLGPAGKKLITAGSALDYKKIFFNAFLLSSDKVAKENWDPRIMNYLKGMLDKIREGEIVFSSWEDMKKRVDAEYPLAYILLELARQESVLKSAGSTIDRGKIALALEERNFGGKSNFPADILKDDPLLFNDIKELGIPIYSKSDDVIYVWNADGLEAVLQKEYQTGKNDEAMIPIITIDGNGLPVARLNKGGSVFDINFRKDRQKQWVRALLAPVFKFFKVPPEAKLLRLTGMTQYVPLLPKERAVLQDIRIKNSLVEVLQKEGVKMVYVFDAEKGKFISTYRGGSEEPLDNEDLEFSTISMPVLMTAGQIEKFKPAVALRLSKEKDEYIGWFYGPVPEGLDQIPNKEYWRYPGLSMFPLAKASVKKILSADPGTVGLVNLDGPDLNGHVSVKNLDKVKELLIEKPDGTFQAIAGNGWDSALECLKIADKAIDEILQAAEKKQGVVILFGDHGSIDDMTQPNHSFNDIPIFVIDFKNKDIKLVKSQQASIKDTQADIAVTILHILGIKKPVEMTGKSLLPESYLGSKDRVIWQVLLDGFGNAGLNDPQNAFAVAMDEEMKENSPAKNKAREVMMPIVKSLYAQNKFMVLKAAGHYAGLRGGRQEDFDKSQILSRDDMLIRVRSFGPKNIRIVYYDYRDIPGATELYPHHSLYPDEDLPRDLGLDELKNNPFLNDKDFVVKLTNDDVVEVLCLDPAQMGSTEYNTWSIGAGRIVKQSIVSIDEIFIKSEMSENQAIREYADTAKKQGYAHFVGILQEAGVHASLRQMYYLIQYFKSNGINKFVFDLASDGRDEPGQDGIKRIRQLRAALKYFDISDYKYFDISDYTINIRGREICFDRGSNWKLIHSWINELLWGTRKIDASAGSAIQQIPVKMGNKTYSVPFEPRDGKVTAENLASVSALLKQLGDIREYLINSQGIDILKKYNKNDFDTYFMGEVLKNDSDSQAAQVIRSVLRFNAKVLAALVYLTRQEKMKSYEGQVRQITDWNKIRAIELGGGLLNNKMLREVLEQSLKAELSRLLPGAEFELILPESQTEEAGIIGGSLFVPEQERRGRVVVGVDAGGTSVKMAGVKYNENGEFEKIVSEVFAVMPENITQDKKAFYDYVKIANQVKELKAMLRLQEYSVSDSVGLSHPGKKEEDGVIALGTCPNVLSTRGGVIEGIDPAKLLGRDVFWGNDALAQAQIIYELSGKRLPNSQIMYAGPGGGLGVAFIETNNAGRISRVRDSHTQHDPYLGEFLIQPGADSSLSGSAISGEERRLTKEIEKLRKEIVQLDEAINIAIGIKDSKTISSTKERKRIISEIIIPDLEDEIAYARRMAEKGLSINKQSAWRNKVLAISKRLEEKRASEAKTAGSALADKAEMINAFIVRVSQDLKNIESADKQLYQRDIVPNLLKAIEGIKAGNGFLSSKITQALESPLTIINNNRTNPKVVNPLVNIFKDTVALAKQLNGEVSVPVNGLKKKVSRTLDQGLRSQILSIIDSYYEKDLKSVDEALYGGIDMAKLSVKAGAGSRATNMPAMDLNNFQGFSFQIIRMAPITNLNSMFGVMLKAEETTNTERKLAYLN